MSHPFGDRVSQHLHRKHGLSQAKLAEGILQAPTVVTAMCKGKRLTGPQARERVVAIITWLHAQDALDTLDEANALLNAAGMAALNERQPDEAGLIKSLRPAVQITPARPRQRHNLPMQLTSFIGREREISGLVAQIETARMLTLIGVGGVGKTRLAIEVAGRALEAFEDGAWFMGLAPVTDAMLMPLAIASALNLVEQPGREPLDLLASYFEERHALLVLDNCEHIIDTCAAVAAQLLSRCPRLHILSTSRETLRVPGEIAHRVAPLALPDAEAASAESMQSAESVALFVDRARASQAAFNLDGTTAGAVARICRQLDGIPLVIELAAAQMLTMTAHEIERRLRQHLSTLGQESRAAAPRHQTMWAALDWSFDLLSPAEQRLMARLWVFSNGWMLEQAELVCADLPHVAAEEDGEEHRPGANGVAPSGVLPLLTRLVHKSLVLAEVQGDQTRYRLLEPIRQYAAEKLDELGETGATHRRHALAYLALAQAAEPHLHSHEQKHWLDQLEREHDNFRAALHWSQGEGGDPDLGLRLAATLWQFWWLHSHMSEGRRWLEGLIQNTNVDVPPVVRAQALLGLGFLTLGQGAVQQAIPQLEEAHYLFRSLDDKAGIVLALNRLGVASVEWQLATNDNDIARGITFLEQSLMIARQTSFWGTATALYDFGMAVLNYQSDYPRAKALLEEGLAVAQQVGDSKMIAATLSAIADAERSMLNFARSVTLAEQSVQVGQEIGDKLEELSALRQLGESLRFMHDFGRATTVLNAAHHLSLELGAKGAESWILNILGFLARDQGDYRRAYALFAQSAVLVRDELQGAPNVFHLLGFASVASAQNEPVRAARLFGASEAFCERMHFRMHPNNQMEYEPYIAATREQLGEKAFAMAWAEGRVMTVDQAVEEAWKV